MAAALPTGTITFLFTDMASSSHVRWGEVVYSPLVGAGEVDVLLPFEKLEALRYLAHLRQDALALINLETIIPITVSSLGMHYPDDGLLRVGWLAHSCPHLSELDINPLLVLPDGTGAVAVDARFLIG